MSTNILDEARLFLLNSLEGQRNSFENKHPWRKGWEFAVLHSLRVESYTVKILAQEPQHPLSEREIILLRLAAILHDVSRLGPREEHAKLGAEKTKNYLETSLNSTLENGEMDRVVEMIADHSNKEVREPDFAKAVLKDADTLDEIGAMSILMASNWLNLNTPFFFYDLRQRLIDFEAPYCDRKMAILNTNGARKILQEKKVFVEGFIAQITDELEADTRTVQRLHEISGR